MTVPLFKLAGPMFFNPHPVDLTTISPSTNHENDPSLIDSPTLPFCPSCLVHFSNRILHSSPSTESFPDYPSSSTPHIPPLLRNWYQNSSACAPSHFDPKEVLYFSIPHPLFPSAPPSLNWSNPTPAQIARYFHCHDCSSHFLLDVGRLDLGRNSEGRTTSLLPALAFLDITPINPQDPHPDSETRFEEIPAFPPLAAPHVLYARFIGSRFLFVLQPQVQGFFSSPSTSYSGDESWHEEDSDASPFSSPT